MIILRVIASVFPIIFVLPFAYWGIVAFLVGPKESSSWEYLLKLGGGFLVVGTSLMIFYFCISFIRGKDHPVFGFVVLSLNLVLSVLILGTSIGSNLDAEILFPILSLLASIISIIPWIKQSKRDSSRGDHAA